MKPLESQNYPVLFESDEKDATSPDFLQAFIAKKNAGIFPAFFMFLKVQFTR